MAIVRLVCSTGGGSGFGRAGVSVLELGAR
jgi:hypothetical protein